MAEQADIYLSNRLTDKIHFIRKLPDGGSDLADSAANGNGVNVRLRGTDGSLIIYAPDGMDTKECPLTVHSEVDLEILCSRTDSTWTIRIEPNDLPAEPPAVVKVTVGKIKEEQ